VLREPAVQAAHSLTRLLSLFEELSYVVYRCPQVRFCGTHWVWHSRCGLEHGPGHLSCLVWLCHFVADSQHTPEKDGQVAATTRAAGRLALSSLYAGAITQVASIAAESVRLTLIQILLQRRGIKVLNE
jgi:hypothetical protein